MKRWIEMRSTWCFAALLVFCAAFCHAQVSPFMALGNAQFFDNNGEILSAGVLYSYVAGTTTQQATYTDYTGTTMNPNPIPFGSGARVSIWLTSSALYKFVLCLQNDGATCAPSDVLFSVDQVPGCPGCSSSGSTNFVGTFISASAGPATTGVLRLASIDSICWRNTAGTTNLCLSKDINDALTWVGDFKLQEIACVLAQAGYDYLCADSSTHHLTMFNNGGTKLVIPGTNPTAATPGHLANYQTNGWDMQDSGASPPAEATVSYSSNPTFTATSNDQLFQITLTGNVTSSTLVTTGLPIPSLIHIEITQDATGGHTFVWPTNALNAPYINTTANSITNYSFMFDGTNAEYIPGSCAFVAKTAAYTLTTGDCLIDASVASASFTLSIPHLAVGHVWTISRTDSSTNTLTVAGDTGNVNGQASITLSRNSTAQCHTDGVGAYCAISVFAGSQLIQYGTDSGCTGSSCGGETFPIPYQTATPTCFCTGINGSCNLQTSGASKTSCAYNASASGGINWMAIGTP